MMTYVEYLTFLNIFFHIYRDWKAQVDLPSKVVLITDWNLESMGGQQRHNKGIRPRALYRIVALPMETCLGGAYILWEHIYFHF